MKWRKHIRALHRDIGYVACALTIAYSISGIAVNHIEDWNPNYTFTETAFAIGPVPSGSYDVMEAHVVAALSLDARDVRGRFLETESDFRIFMPEGQEARVDLRTGRGTLKRIKNRPFLYEVNMLHLNSIKGAWTWVADLFALALLTLAITGLFIHKGPPGLAGRGKWFVAAGFAIPVLFILYVYYGA